MATGGTVPSSRTQSVTFYNTTGVIENRKNIYLAPRFSKYPTLNLVGKKVQSAYLAVFNQVCPPSSSYTGIEISSWSPQDRTLKVKGNIDDFRLVSEEGDCLNYFILQRNVTKGEGQQAVTKTYYYGFFITGVQQAGGSSVLLSIQPDDLTNVFYLHNEHVLTALDVSNDYEPFNEKMKNCYVNRQHYNRVKVTKIPVYAKDIDDAFEHNVTPLEINAGGEWALVYGEDIIEYYEEALAGNYSILGSSQVFDSMIVRVRDASNLDNIIAQYDAVEVQLKGQNSYITIIDSHAESTQILWNTGEHVITIERYPNYTVSFEDQNVCYVFAGEVYDKVIRYDDELEPDNMKVFLNQEETFRFKYQYRNLKYPLSIYDGNFTEDEILAIKENDTFTNLSQDLRKKIVRACISYLVVETKSPEITLPYYYSNQVTDPSATYVIKYRNDLGQLIAGKRARRSNPVIAYPFLQIPEVFEKYNLDSIFSICYVCYGLHAINIVTAQRDNIEQLLYTINKNAIADYLFSVYYAKEVNIPESAIEVDLSNSRIKFDCILPSNSAPNQSISNVQTTHINKGLYLSGLLHEPTMETPEPTPVPTHDFDINHAIVVDFRNGVLTTLYAQYGALGIIVSGYDKNRFSIKVDENIPNLQSNFYDPVLEAEPYSFYSISYLSGYEMTFNKNRYYVEGLSSTINVIHYISINGAIKEGFIPDYTVDDYTSKYFNEGMIFTTSSALALVSDSYSSYYYQNQAQMKNQYAVANYEATTDLIQKFFISSPNQVGLRASKAGGWGALAETGNQVMGWVDDIIDWAQNKHVIGMNQKAKLADMGTKPDSIKQVGSDVIFDLNTNEYQPFLNHYTIDELSYNSIAKVFERTGYQINLYDSINTMDRVGWNFVKLNSFDYVADITISQENEIRRIFTEGVTLLHDKSYLTSGHNFETILEGGD